MPSDLNLIIYLEQCQNAVPAILHLLSKQIWAPSKMPSVIESMLNLICDRIISKPT